MASWGLAEAKAKFSEVVDRAVNHEPQEIMRNGKPVAVMVSKQAWLELKKDVAPKHQNLAEFFRRSPLRGAGLDLSRMRVTPRKVDL